MDFRLVKLLETVLQIIQLKLVGKSQLFLQKRLIFLAKIINKLPIFLDFMDIIDIFQH